MPLISRKNRRPHAAQETPVLQWHKWRLCALLAGARPFYGNSDDFVAPCENPCSFLPKIGLYYRMSRIGFQQLCYCRFNKIPANGTLRYGGARVYQHPRQHQQTGGASRPRSSKPSLNQRSGSERETEPWQKTLHSRADSDSWHARRGNLAKVGDGAEPECWAKNLPDRPRMSGLRVVMRQKFLVAWRLRTKSNYKCDWNVDSEISQKILSPSERPQPTPGVQGRYRSIPS